MNSPQGLFTTASVPRKIINPIQMKIRKRLALLPVNRLSGRKLI